MDDEIFEEPEQAPQAEPTDLEMARELIDMALNSVGDECFVPLTVQPPIVLAMPFLDQHGRPHVQIGPHSYRFPATGSAHYRSEIGLAVRNVWWESKTLRAIASDSPSVNRTVGVLETVARFCGRTRFLAVRAAAVDGRYLIDLGQFGNANAIQIDASGWRIVDASDDDVAFRRPQGTLPMTVPAKVSDRDAEKILAQWGNTLGLNDEQRSRVVTWLLSALRSGLPCPVLRVTGSPGSGKSVLCHELVTIVDPRTAALRAPARNSRDLFAAATNARVLAFTNVSNITDTVSDSLCRMASGEADAQRALFTTDDQVTSVGERPILLNGVSFAMRSDLLSRSLLVDLPDRDESRRRTEAELHAELDEMRPKVLGALLTMLVRSLRTTPSPEAAHWSRMADAAALTAATFGDEAARILWQTNAAEAREHTLDDWVVWPALNALLALNNGTYEGTASELLQDLRSTAKQGNLPTGGWPVTAPVLAQEVRRNLEALASTGNVTVTFRRTTARRTMVFQQGEPAPSAGSTATGEGFDW